jgi:hypothetical protein
MMTATASPTFQEAFTAAKEEHSKPAGATEQAAAAEVSTETADDTATSQDTEQAQGATTEGAGKPETSDLISDAEYQALSKKYPNDPARLVKEVNKAFTQKTQALAAERKTVQALEPYRDLIADYEADPEAAVRRLADMHGLTIAPATTETAATGDKPAATASPSDDTTKVLREALGPELEFLADKLGPAFDKLVQATAKAAVASEVKPLKDQQDVLVSRAAVEQRDAVMTAFEAKYPDWKQHEAAMVELAEKFPPSGKVTELEYLGMIHTLATKDTQAAATVKKTIERMTKGAETTERQIPATSASRVKATPPGVPTFREAYEAAKRGERFE